MYAGVLKFRERLKAGQTCFGSGVTFSDPTVVEALAPTSDFLWIDLEHTLMGFDALQAHLIAARAGGVASLVRIPIADVGYVKRVLDSGAGGIIVPWIQSAQEVERMVSACRYPPLGTRGFGPRRPTHYGRYGGPAYFAAANASVFASIQIETRSALEDLDAILAVEQLDSVVIGPQDLSASLGLAGQIEHPQLIAAYETIIAKAHQAGKFVGIGMGPQPKFAERVARMGVNWIQCGNDFSYMVDATEAMFASLRGAVAANRG